MRGIRDDCIAAGGDAGVRDARVARRRIRASSLGEACGRGREPSPVIGVPSSFSSPKKPSPTRREELVSRWLGVVNVGVR